MFKLPISPDQTSYSIEYGEKNISVKLDGGLSKTRQDVVNPSNIVNCQWSLDRKDFNLLQTFKRANEKEGGIAFLADLYIDGASLVEYIAKIVPNTWKLSSQSGHQFVVTAQFEIEYKDYDVGYIELIASADGVITGTTFWQNVAIGNVPVVLTSGDTGEIWEVISDANGHFTLPATIEKTATISAVGTIDLGFGRVLIYGDVVFIGLDVTVLYRVNNSAQPLFFINRVDIDTMTIDYGDGVDSKDFTTTAITASEYAVYTTRTIAPNSEFTMRIYGADSVDFYMEYQGTQYKGGDVLEVINYATTTRNNLTNCFKNHTFLRRVYETAFSRMPNIQTLYGVFENCSSLNAVPAKLLNKLTLLRNATNLFMNTGIMAIPGNIFANNPLITNVTNAFYGTRITAIDKNVFSNCADITIFTGCFQNCTNLSSIPVDIFYNNRKAVFFNNIFRNCTSITTAPLVFEWAVDALYFNYAFYGCTSLTLVSNRLFYYNTKATDFNYTFAYCASLATTPGGVFDRNTLITTMEGTFNNSGIRLINEDIFRYQTAMINCTYMFAYCVNLSSIPVNVFYYNTELTNISSCFRGCSNVPDLPNELLWRLPKLTSVNGTFGNMTKLTYQPQGLFSYNPLLTDVGSVFSGNSGFTSIFEHIFYHNKEIVNASYVLYGCSGITTLPAGLFAFHTKITSFVFAFSGMTGITTIPETLFNACTELTLASYTFATCRNLLSIPSNLFRYNTKVTTFNSCFGSCSNLQTVGDGLFTYNIEVNNFGSTFNSCTNLRSYINNIFPNASYPNVTDTSYLFYRCLGGSVAGSLGIGLIFIDKMPNVSVKTGTFREAIGLYDYASIPAAWK